MIPFIIHIPHSSAHFPFFDGYVVDPPILESELLKLTDWHTEDLFNVPHMEHLIVRADFSRIFCDVERFEDDAQEFMAKFGMGVLYEKTDAGILLRDVYPKLREQILREYYRPHHQRLSQAVSLQLKDFNEARIIDAHSFSNIPFLRDLDKSPERPDICLGTDEFHTPPEWVDFAEKYFQRKHFSLAINRPYSGTIVPLKYFRKDKRVKSMMVEINRDLYLEEGTTKKSRRYNETKAMIADFLKKLQLCLYD